MWPELNEAQRRMREAHVPEQAIAVFGDHYHQLREGATGFISEDSIEPLGDVPQLTDLPRDEEQLRAAANHSVVIKLNGGLGTSMGLRGPKSALEVRDGLTFLDIIARQVLALREHYGSDTPLILMNSARTRDQSAQILARYRQLAVRGLPLDFEQSVEPKLAADTLAPIDWPADRSLEWTPPGHGDVYVSLVASGLLSQLREQGIRYAFLSNADNLGATLDPVIPAWMAQHQIPYVAEVSHRTSNDRKGGHLARRRADGALVLREGAQVTPADQEHFSDVDRHRLFNTNNVWVDLDALAESLDAHGGRLSLPIIVNRKTVDPTDPRSPAVIQLESAMGAAIEHFPGAQALQVTRRRFLPVKTTNELLLVRSDRYALDDHFQVVALTDDADPRIDLDDHYRLIDDFEEYFAHGAPSLQECTALTVEGAVTFGAGVRCVGDVSIRVTGALSVPDRATLKGRISEVQHVVASRP